MIKFIGKIKREESIKGIKQNINKLQNIFISLILLFPIIYLLFEYNILKTDITESGDKVATCKITYSIKDGLCSGFLVSENGFVITAGHCVDDLADGEQIFLSFDKSKNKNYLNMPARVVFLPDDTKEDDYAILKLEQPIEIIPLKVAQKIENPDTYSPTITVIGYPGPDQNYENTNVVRVYNRTVDSTTFEINEIYKGMSGGPVIDNNTKEVIGIIKSKIIDYSIVDKQLTQMTGQAIIKGAIDKEGISYCEKIQQVFQDPRASHINW